MFGCGIACWGRRRCAAGRLRLVCCDCLFVAFFIAYSRKDASKWAVAVAGGLLLGIRLRFHNHLPQQHAIRLPFHQQAADELGSDDLGGAGEEGWGALGESGGYGSGLGMGGGYWEEGV